LELEGAKKPSSFYLSHFSLSKWFYPITKDANVLHLESDNSWEFWGRGGHMDEETKSRKQTRYRGQQIIT